MKPWFKVYGIWPLNLVAIVGKFGPSHVFPIVEEERP
jgi:nitrate reductase NapE component